MGFLATHRWQKRTEQLTMVCKNGFLASGEPHQEVSDCSLAGRTSKAVAAYQSPTSSPSAQHISLGLQRHIAHNPQLYNML
jgi:hypothetical protein